MSQKEEIEVSRDWSDRDLDLEGIDEYRKVSELVFAAVLKIFLEHKVVSRTVRVYRVVGAFSPVSSFACNSSDGSVLLRGYWCVSVAFALRL